MRWKVLLALFALLFCCVLPSFAEVQIFLGWPIRPAPAIVVPAPMPTVVTPIAPVPFPPGTVVYYPKGWLFPRWTPGVVYGYPPLAPTTPTK